MGRFGGWSQRVSRDLAQSRPEFIGFVLTRGKDKGVRVQSAKGRHGEFKPFTVKSGSGPDHYS
jgi:hypothetical protein